MRQGGHMADTETRADLRLTVHQFRRSNRRRVFPPVLHVGALTGPAVHWPLEDDSPAPDAGLRAEIASALLSRALLDHDRPAWWLTRVGVPEPHDLDLAWAPVLDRVSAEAGIEPRCIVVVTKAGWFEPLGDDRATWTRLRVRGTV